MYKQVCKVIIQLEVIRYECTRIQRICICLDGRLDTAYYGLTISDVTPRLFVGRQIWRRDWLALYIEHLLERRDPLRLPRTLYVWVVS